MTSKFERMELNQKLEFRPKSYKNVASPPDQDFPDTVLLFELRCAHPALRVTKNIKIIEISYVDTFNNILQNISDFSVKNSRKIVDFKRFCKILKISQIVLL